MSTRSTIAYGKNFHFYHELNDEDHVHLRLETTNFEAGYGRVTVEIPIHVWEVIRHLGAPDLDLVDKTDGDLAVIVESEIDRRIEEHENALRQNPESAKLMRLFGSFVYGPAEAAREEQIRRGLDYYRARRQRQRQIESAFKALRAEQPGAKN